MYIHIYIYIEYSISFPMRILFTICLANAINARHHHEWDDTDHSSTLCLCAQINHERTTTKNVVCQREMHWFQIIFIEYSHSQNRKKKLCRTIIAEENIIEFSSYNSRLNFKISIGFIESRIKMSIYFRFICKSTSLLKSHSQYFVVVSNNIIIFLFLIPCCGAFSARSEKYTAEH